jgi:peroxiredoxin
MRPIEKASLALLLAMGLPVWAGATGLKVGDKAPDFALTDTNWKKVRLHDYLGKKNVVLAFYVLAFTGG